LFLTAVLFAVSVDAQQEHATFQYGDIIAGGQTPVMITAFGRFDWFLPDGRLNKRMNETLGELPLDVALDAAGNVYWPTFFTIRVMDNTGRYFRDFPDSPTLASSIAFDRAGNAYIVATGRTLLKTTPGGDLLATYVLPIQNPPSAVVSSIDLAADQCTMYYTAFGKRVFRYDLCLDTALPDLISNLPGLSAEQLRILPDGSVLVAMVDAIVRVSSTGAIVQTYDLPGQHEWTNVAVNVDGRSFWATSQQNAHRFDLPTGTVLASFQSSDYWFRAITVVGEPRAATGVASAIPTLSESLLSALILMLIVVALTRLRTG
jgi:sugar lactone lactonase YvrE